MRSTTRSVARRCGPRRGAAAAELAIVLAPVLAFILVAGTDFARLFNAYLTITSCARNGALYGCLDTAHATNTAGIQTAALTDAGSLSPQPSVSASTGTDANNNPYVAVTVTYTFSTIASFPRIPSTMNLSRTIQMRVIQDTPG
jgi:hypothetical protein